MRYSLFPVLLSALVSLTACKRDAELRNPGKGYPKEIAGIVLGNCATSGCHNREFAPFAAGLNLESWESMMQGGKAGACVIPYRADQSYLMYFMNTDSTLGPVLHPTMPFNGTPLSREQYLKIRDWVNAGAPSQAGEVKFRDNPFRSKVYITNQGCDLVTVMDKQSNLIMGYVNVGQIAGFTESPHAVKVSPDGKHWYVVFLGSNPYFEIYSTETDSLVDKVLMGMGDYNTISISPDGKYAASVAFNGKKIAIVDLESHTFAGLLNVSELPHGSAFNKTNDRLYVTQQTASKLYRFDYNGNPAQPSDLNEIDLIQGVNPVSGSRLDPHEVLFSPDGHQYFVTCQGTKEVRIFQSSNDSLLAVVPVGDYPVEMALAPSRDWLFVTCMEDTTTFHTDPGKRGSVAVINYRYHSLVDMLYTGYQPHGISVDESEGLVYVANRNTNPNGPAPHHTSACGGRNGYLSLIDMNTLKVKADFNCELSVDPYSVSIRH